MKKEIPKYWYVLYKDKDEFDELTKWFETTLYTFENRVNECGFCNWEGHGRARGRGFGLWFDSKYENDMDEAKELNAVQLSFEEWQELICGKTLISKKTDLTKLLHILKFIEEYGK